MSKNVAVFVDVANIFYAAKAAGVDIDYVTLLKSATAGRDFVRAYAYTGLDPENDNQISFHRFLRSSGYKVVSKDIRKYGDGRIKANLDIELVVDMMRMAQHIDIAVVISGDGDFAPAIRAVQQMGVRVEVISFRGNTSSDLMEVADVFTDISGIARVEKGVRSGRRIAAEDDLSMTAVPEKETDNGPRRRRGGGGRRDGRDERPSRPAVLAPVADGALPGNVIVLPGERLSRVAPEDEEPDEELAEAAGENLPETDEATEEGRRRRRRRGGRGRGRGRRPDGENGELGVVTELGQIGEPRDAVAPVPMAAEEDEYLEEELAPLPQHSTFGSVWDTQIGVASAPVTASPSDDDDEDYEDEPEIPEYLLAERRQQGQRGGANRGPNRGRQGGPGGRQGGRPGGYQAALDRERFGRGTAGGMFGGSPNRVPAGRPQGGGQGRPTPQPQPSRRPQPQPPRELTPAAPSASSEPWSEVPPEVQEMLRAEMARRGTARHAAPSRASARPEAPAAEEARSSAGEARSSAEETRAPSRRRSPRTSAPGAAPAVEVVGRAEAPPLVEAPAVEARPAATRRRTTKAAAPTAPTAEPAEAAAPAEAPASGAKPATRRRIIKAPVAAAEAFAEAPAPKAKPAARSRATKAAAPEASAAEAPAAEAKPAPRRRSTKASSTEATEG